MQHPYRKKWGQNFLRDDNIINKIINCLEPNKEDIILEIGPGDGAITNKLSTLIYHLHAVDIDPLLIKYLSQKKYRNVSLYNEDILKWDFSQLPNKIKIIGNLPYYISSPIFFQLLKKNIWRKMVLMFQKELSDRILSIPGKKTYGRISVMSQVYTNTKNDFLVPHTVFQPMPKVDSSVITFLPKNNTPELNKFSKLIRKSFSHRRKKLKNNLPEIYNLGIIDKWADLRPGEITPQEYVDLYNRI